MYRRRTAVSAKILAVSGLGLSPDRFVTILTPRRPPSPRPADGPNDMPNDPTDPVGPTAASSVAPALPYAPAAAMSHYRWVICGLLFAATTINYVDRQILSLLKPVLEGQFRLTDTDFGLINSVFAGAYGVSVLAFGWLIDRWGTKLGYALSITGWSLAAMSHVLVGSVGGFSAARVALGLAEGGNFPAAVKATAQWFPKRERALATALFNSGANVGAVLAPAIIPSLALTLGWRSAFLFAGVAGLLWLGAWFPLFDYPERSRRVSAAELAYIESDAIDAGTVDPSGGGGRMTWGAVLRYRQAWAFVAAKFFTDPVWGLLLIWLPDFFHRTRNLDIKGSRWLLVAIYSIVTVLSIGGGALSGFLVGRGFSVTRARKAAMLLFAVAVVPVAFATHVGNWTAVLLLGLAGAAHQAWSATIYTTVSDLFPKRAVATLIGVGTAAGAVSGMTFPLVTGHILDTHANGYAILFAVSSVAYLIAFAANHLLAPSFEPVRFDVPPVPEQSPLE